jgi:hypothetical protein
VALFKHIMDLKRAALAKLSDKRKAKRYAVGPAFPLKATIILPDLDQMGRRGKDPKEAIATGRDWSGTPVNISESGLSVQLPPAAVSTRGQSTLVALVLDGHRIEFPCTVAHFRVHAASAICGLKLDTKDLNQRKSYLQLVKIVAMGSTFEAVKNPGNVKKSEGQTVEQYKSDHNAVLTAWRDRSTGKVDSFELVMNDHHCARGVVGRANLEIFSSGKKDSEKIAWSVPGFSASAGVENPEVRLLYRWVTFNLPKTIPADLRDAMRLFTVSRGEWKAPTKK